MLHVGLYSAAYMYLYITCIYYLRVRIEGDLSDVSSNCGTPKGTDSSKSASTPQSDPLKTTGSHVVESLFSNRRSPTKRKLHVSTYIRITLNAHKRVHTCVLCTLVAHYS